jgi:sulfur carrier protein
VKVLLRNPKREITVDAPVRVKNMLEQLGIHPDTVLVIANSTLVPHDAMLHEDDTVEIRPVISGGAW